MPKIGVLCLADVRFNGETQITAELLLSTRWRQTFFSADYYSMATDHVT